MCAQIIEARVKQKKDTLANWEENPMILLDGEQAFVVSDSGQPVNFKIGDGTKSFSELPYWIQYDQAAFVPVSGLVLPTPAQEVAYTILGEGTYTHASGNVVVPDGHWGVANWDGSAWGFSDMGELPESENKIDDWQEGEYAQGSQVFHNGQIWEVSTPTTTEEPGVGSDWINKMPDNEFPLGILNITSGAFDFDTVNKVLNITGLGSVNFGKNRYIYDSPQTINFPGVGSDAYFNLLFNRETLLFEIIVQTQLSTLTSEYAFIGSIFLHSDTRELIVNGVPTYTQNGKNPPNKICEWVGVRYVTGNVVLHNNDFWIANQNTLPESEPGASDRWDLLFNKYRRGQLIASSNTINFNLTDKKIEISGTTTVSVGNSRYIVNTPQEIDFPGISGGYYAMMLNINSWQASYGNISLVNVNDVSGVDPRYIFVGALVSINSTNDLVVNGIADYLINGQPKSFRLPDWVDRAYRPGELVYHNNRTWKANDPQPIVGSVPGVSARWSELHPQKQGYFNGPASSLSFDLTEKTITTRGTSAIVINGERMLITADQVVDFPSDNGGYFALLFRKTGGVISTVSVSNLGGVDPSLILFGTYYHNNNNNTIVVNGVPDYHINGAPKDEKFFTFDSDLPYYNATTDLSMTENDPIVLKDQSVDYLYSLYDDLMSQHPEYITKEQFGAQEDGNGGELPLYYYRFRPSNLIKNTSSFGGDQRLKVVITAATHGGEKTCGMATWILMDAICNQWQDDEYLQALRWNCEFVVVACASPYQWNQNALGLSPGRLNANGVDPNRNFPQGWAGGNSIPGSTDYRGPSPLSEIECQAVYNLLKEEYTQGAIAFDFHTFVGSSVPYDIAWVIAPGRTNNQAQSFARLIAREYKKKLPMVDQDPDTPIARVSDNVAGGMTYKTYDAMGYRAYLMEINENFMIVPGYVRNDNYALKYGTESMANMLRMVIKSSLS